VLGFRESHDVMYSVRNAEAERRLGRLKRSVSDSARDDRHKPSAWLLK
jgi:hypothetical protein